MQKKTKNKKDENKSNENNSVYIALKEQLITNDNYNAYTEELLQRYIKFTQIEDDLNDDIEKRGVSVYWCNGGGQEGYKKNDSISELAKINAQKLKLLNSLGIKPQEAKEGQEEYEV